MCDVAKKQRVLGGDAEKERAWRRIVQLTEKQKALKQAAIARAGERGPRPGKSVDISVNQCQKSVLFPHGPSGPIARRWAFIRAELFSSAVPVLRNLGLVVATST